MPTHDAPADAPDGSDAPDAFDSLDPAERERLLAAVPAGAIALAGLTVVLLLIGWFALYLFVYLPRGAAS